MNSPQAPRNTILVGDVRKRLAEIPDNSVDTVITSPPYVQLRNYGVKNQMGLEASVDEWVDELRLVARGLARVLKEGGSLWLVLGDSYSRQARTGAPAKSLLLGPERLAIALVEDGWILRSKIIWAKTNAMPASVRDRLACSWEVIYFLVRSPNYAFDLDAIRVPHRSAQRVSSTPKTASPLLSTAPGRPSWAGPLAGSNSGLTALKARGIAGHPLGKNPGDVWPLATASFRGEHFATFPPRLVERPLLATCPERTCTRCGQPWQREPARTRGHLTVRSELRPTCTCRKGWQPGLVLDVFFGAGTVALVAEQHQRDWVGIELNPKFAALATERIANARGESASDEGRRRVA